MAEAPVCIHATAKDAAMASAQKASKTIRPRDW
jgi:hypothetical protein